MAEMKTLNGYEIVDAKARADIEELKDSYHFKFSDTGEYIDCDEEMTKFAEQIISGKDACAYIYNSLDNLFYPALIFNGGLISSNQIQLVQCAFNPTRVIANESLRYDIYILGKNSAGIWRYKRDNNGPYTFTLATTEQLAALEARIAVLEGNN